MEVAAQGRVTAGEVDDVTRNAVHSVSFVAFVRRVCGVAGWPVRIDRIKERSSCDRSR